MTRLTAAEGFDWALDIRNLKPGEKRGMSFENYGKKQSDWWVPAVTGGIAGLSVPILGPWLSPLLDAWYGPEDSVWRTLFQALLTGLIVGGAFIVLARLTKAWRRK